MSKVFWFILGGLTVTTSIALNGWRHHTPQTITIPPERFRPFRGAA